MYDDLALLDRAISSYIWSGQGAHRFPAPDRRGRRRGPAWALRLQEPGAAVWAPQRRPHRRGRRPGRRGALWNQEHAAAYPGVGPARGRRPARATVSLRQWRPSAPDGEEL